MCNDQRDSFVFYRSFQEALSELPDSKQLLLYRAITNYALDHQEPEVDGIAKIVWLLIKPQLEANWRKFNRVRRGGAPSGNNNATRTTAKQQINNKQTTDKQQINNRQTTDKQQINNRQTTDKQPNVNENVNENNNDNVNDNANINAESTEITISDFRPPILSEIRGYISTQRLSVDADNFYDYYASNGWMMGKNPMADWRAALRTWSRKTELDRAVQPKILINDL